jgi:hypothetical protein
MDILVYLGTAVSLLGLIGLGICIVRAMKIRRLADQSGAEEALQKLIPLNMGALCLAFFGLIMVGVGLML